MTNSTIDADENLKHVSYTKEHGIRTKTRTKGCQFGGDWRMRLSCHFDPPTFLSCRYFKGGFGYFSNERGFSLESASITLVEKKYCSSWFKVQELMISHSITFHSVYFELSTVPKRETLKGVDLYSPRQSFSGVWCGSTSHLPSPKAPDRIERHSYHGLWMWRNTQTQVYTNEE